MFICHLFSPVNDLLLYPIMTRNFGECRSWGKGGGYPISLFEYVVIWGVPLFWVLFRGCSQRFGYLFGLFSDFWVSFFVKLDLSKNNPDF